MNALILGGASAVCTVMSYFGVPFVGFAGVILGIIAWVVGNKACKENPEDKQAKAGKILGMVVTIWAIISVVILMVVFGLILGISASLI